jgi:hypothetical protein
MTIHEAQRDVRLTFLGSFPGQFVSGLLWLASAALTVAVSPRAGMLTLVVAGMFIFPLSQLVLRLMGRRASLPAGHPMNALAMQIAFTLPLSLPLVAAATLHRAAWFHPAMMIVLGAHYLPFTFLYGKRSFLVLAGVLLAAGYALGLARGLPAALGAWVTGVALLVFAFVALAAARREERALASRA